MFRTPEQSQVFPRWKEWEGGRRGNWDKHVKQDWVDTLLLARNGFQKQNYRSQKARLTHLENFPELQP